MDQSVRREYLIRCLLVENREYAGMQVPEDDFNSRRMLRSLMNIRPAGPADDGFLRIQDDYLKGEIASKGVVDYRSIPEVEPGIRLWKGDITLLKCGAIVNAANSGMTGCYSPCHACIDNCIHTFAGIQLRSECDALMKRQGFPEPTGKAKITGAYNLPCDHVIHTVGPIVQDELTDGDRELLASCYRSCLETADANSVGSIAFCCISTGVFRFPNDEAARIAVDTVRDYRRKSQSGIEVIFNVFKDIDEQLYRQYLSHRRAPPSDG